MDLNLSTTYIFVRGRQLEGTYPGCPETGVWPTTTNRILCGWGVPPREAWPDTGAGWPPREPPGIDLRAKDHRLCCYQRVRTLDECKDVMASNNVITVAVEVNEGWSDPPGGTIPLTASPTIGSHSVLLVGYDDDKQQFTFKNSWGASWGDQGYGYLPYDVFDSTWIEGWTSPIVPYEPSTNATPTLRQLGIREHGGGVLHLLDLIDESDERIGWAFALERTSLEFIEVEELFVRPAFRRRHHGAALVAALNKLASSTDRKLRLWVPFSDTSPEDLRRLEGLIQPVGLTLKASVQRWAGLEASPSGAACDQGLPRHAPARPTSSSYLARRLAIGAPDPSAADQRVR